MQVLSRVVDLGTVFVVEGDDDIETAAVTSAVPTTAAPNIIQPGGPSANAGVATAAHMTAPSSAYRRW